MFKDFFRNRLKYYVRYQDAGDMLELFLVFAVASLLIIRIYLELTNYPQLGGGSFHIAHMLWGGFLMMAAIFLLLIFLNKQAKQAAAIIGGIGFGTFIDELGKFITNDNNYFYQPTVALIYVIFIGLFFLIRRVDMAKQLTKAEYEVNALEEMKELVIDHLDETERQKALKLLEQSDPNSVLVRHLKSILDETKGRNDVPRSIFTFIKRSLNFIYIKIIKTSWFSQILVTFFAVFAMVGLVWSLMDFTDGISVADFGEFTFALLTAALVVRGVFHLHDDNRLKAYHNFKNAVLVSIFLTQFFLFLKDQFSALFGLLVSVAAFIGCQYLITQEQGQVNPAKPIEPEKQPIKIAG